MNEEQKINGLPKDWKIVDLNSIGKIETGSTPSKQNLDFYADDFPFYKPTDLEAGYNVKIARDNLSKSGIKQARFLPENSILVTCIGATIGKTGLIRKAGASNQQINAIIPFDKVDPGFVYYQVIGPQFQKQIKDNASATTLPILNKTKFQNLPFVFAPIENQQTIVSKIEELFSELDKGIEEIKTVQQQLKVYRQAVLKWAFEGKLTNEDVKDGELPEGWITKKFADATNNFDGRRIPLSRTVRSKRKGTYRYYGATEIVDHIDDFIFEGKYLLIGEDGANLLSKNRPLAFIVEGQFWVNNHAHVLQTKENLLIEFLMNYFNSISIGQYVTGTAQPKLTQANLNKIPVPIPPAEEQKQIVQEIESRLSVCDKIEETITNSLKQAEALRQSILKKAFEGRLL